MLARPPYYRPLITRALRKPQPTGYDPIILACVQALLEDLLLRHPVFY
jgi:hypothetical protein